MGGGHPVSASVPPTDTNNTSQTPSTSSREQSLALARSQVADDKQAVADLTSTAAETKRDAGYTRDCYFEAHAHALEEAIAHKTTIRGELTARR